ncbi:dienelactone hydrolase family protein [Clathrospora elynae]|uniref:Dienelactone hydrolase family protein n=1 Tax=Clathrospora elynae TaxID=706981 RepID=A0A6A5SUQ9_9PLEO|nr:dienelactone hydrolase family protein [Clathrospora elynae]
MSSPKTFDSCCLKSFTWDGTPTGHEATLANNKTYITGSNPNAAVLYIHDVLGWDFSNARLLADHFAREANVTVYLPDFFGGELLDKEKVQAGKWDELDLPGFKARNSRVIREPEILAAARALRSKPYSYPKLGAVGYCYGGWAVCRLAAFSHDSQPLVDAIVCAHPSLIIKQDFDDIAVPVQFLAPEVDSHFTDELKAYVFQTMVLEKKGVAMEWTHFPGVKHGCLTKGNEGVEGEREAMIKGKDAAVRWFRQWLF